eukprot:TRINITY_DN1307_c1_g1_i4.p1 TRINITY_DN1307_c1_g1~~TRINITY_DN1307_c1_g1_i4.p1  ORF type:complete len:842 (-),score=197.14 TRINITY_DN1307_c1_g1_i4:142-2667(-)
MEGGAPLPSSRTGRPGRKAKDGAPRRDNAPDDSGAASSRSVRLRPTSSGSTASIKRSPSFTRTGSSMANNVHHEINITVRVEGTFQSEDGPAAKSPKAANSKGSSKASMQIAYDLFQDSVTSDMYGPPHMQYEATHKVVVDDDLISALNDYTVELRTIHRSGAPAAKALPSSPDKAKKASQLISTPGTIPPAPGQNIKAPLMLRESLLSMSLQSLLGGQTVLSLKFDSSNEGDAPSSPALVSGELPSGMCSFSVTITLSEPVLTPALMKRLNPLCVCVERLKNLPHTPFPSFDHMASECEPAYVAYKFLDTPPVRSKGLPQAKSIEWNFRRYYFAGLYDPDLLFDYLENAPFFIELHDRDRKVTPMALANMDIPMVGVFDPDSTSTRLVVDKDPPPPLPSVTTTNSSDPLAAIADLVARAVSVEDHPTTTAMANSHGVATFSLKDLCARRTSLRLRGDVMPLHPSHIHTHTPATHTQPRTETATLPPPSPVPVVSDKEKDLNTAQARDKDAPRHLDTRGRLRASTEQGLSSPLPHTPSLAAPELLAHHARPVRAEPLRFVSLAPPGPYMLEGTSLMLQITLAEPLNPSSILPPTYSRLVAVFDLEGSRKASQHSLSIMNRIIAQHNAAVLQVADASSLASYSISSAQLDDRATPCDLITGFMVLDPDCAIICMEGAAAQGLATVAQRLTEADQAWARAIAGASSGSYISVASGNPVLSRRRMYGRHSAPGLKEIRLSLPLDTLVQDHEIHLRTKEKVSRACYSGIHALHMLATTSELNHHAIHNLHILPEPPMLLAVEHTFGSMSHPPGPLTAPQTASPTAAPRIPGTPLFKIKSLQLHPT